MLFRNIKNGRGFTLIELLVVVAIIGLLAALILVGLKGARNKAKDSAIMRELAQIRIISQMILIESGAYDAAGNALCASNTLNDANIKHPDLKVIEDEVNRLYGSGGVVSCYADAGSYCVSSPLAYGIVFCIDSGGIASTIKSCTVNKVCE